ncbi:MAG: hypothetical protein NC247_00535 [Ruminococcus flavefaciens]|nr:hypothetical protein [Ruminococcus flavefaciens]MCM1361066.1 hypothetical protein [Clostridiales bacterium]MCM1434596.1 hypothetical protein [Ruminococcus flavefaciens]
MPEEKENDIFKRLDDELYVKLTEVMKQTMFNITGDALPEWKEFAQSEPTPTVWDAFRFVFGRAVENCDPKIVQEYLESRGIS